MKHIIIFILYILTAITLIATFGLGTILLHQLAIQVNDALGVIVLGAEAVALSVLFYKLIY